MIYQRLSTAEQAIVPKELATSFSSGQLQILLAVQKDYARFADRESDLDRDLSELISATAEQLGYQLNSFEVDQIQAYLERSNQPFGILQELINDPKVNDLIISSFDHISVQCDRNNYRTSLSFPSPDHYQAYVEKLLTKSGISYSHKQPIADAMYTDYTRIHAVHSSLCDHGPYLTIRINRFSRIDLNELAKRGLAPKVIIDYLQQAVISGMTLMIAGEVGSGKTTLARALAAAIPETESILVIEDTPEISLFHPYVRYLRTRVANLEGAGKISPAECIRAGMRMAMNRIIFGEIRDAEAAEAFVDVCSSGHPGLSTVHARSASEALSRLELFLGRIQKGVGREVLCRQLANSIQLIVYLDICRQTGKRRIKEIREICGYADQTVRHNVLFTYQDNQEEPGWKIVNRVSRICEIGSLGELFSDLCDAPSYITAASVDRLEDHV